MQKFVLTVGDYEVKSVGRGFIVHRIENGKRVDRKWFYSVYATFLYIYENSIGEVKEVEDLFLEVKKSREMVCERINVLLTRLGEYWHHETEYDKIQEGKVVDGHDAGGNG